MTAACAFILAATLSSTPAETRTGGGALPQPSAGPIATAIATAPQPEPALEPWMIDRPLNRPGAMKALYGTLGALQVLDIYSTRRALNRGGSEVNPLLEKAAGNEAAMMAVKAISTASTIYFAERAWKKNRKGAVVLMAIVNGLTAAVVANNLRNAR
jgi:hypothetical protein